MKQNTKLKKQLENRNCSNCRRSKRECPNDGSCKNLSLWEPYKNPQLTKAKEIMKKLLDTAMGWWDRGIVKNEAEQFLSE